MKAPTTALRFSEAKALLDYGFSNYSSYQFSTENEIVKNITVNQGVQKSTNAIYSSTKSVMLQKGQEAKVVQEVKIPDDIPAPVSQGEKIGEINYFLDGNQIGSVDIVSDTTVKKVGFINMSSYIFKQWFSLLRSEKN